MKHIAFLSFGKDSIAQLIKIKELGLPLDEVVYVDIRYTPEISGEHPTMAAWIPTAEKIIKEKLGYTVKHLSAKYSFREYFYRKKQKGAHVGEIYGFPFQIGAWCNSRLKLDVIKQYENSLHDEITEYIGIAADEVERMFSLRARATDKLHKRSVLYENGITERDAFDICKPYDLVSPIYGITDRGGCWFCLKQRIYSVYRLWKEYPEYFNDLKMIEKDSRCLMLKTQSLEDLEKRFIGGYIPKQRKPRAAGNFTPRRAANTKEVCIPACAEHEGYKTVKVKLQWVCPVCGRRRGKISNVRSYDGSLCLVCDGWINPCGHVDKYDAVRDEAASNGLNPHYTEGDL